MTGREQSRTAGTMRMMLAGLLACLAMVLMSAPHAHAQDEAPAVTAEIPQLILRGVAVTVPLKGPAARIGDGSGWVLEAGEQRISATAPEKAGETPSFSLMLEGSGATAITLRAPDGSAVSEVTRTPAPGWVSLLPALIAIISVIFLREVVSALALGIWVGASLVYGLSIGSAWPGFLDILPVYVTKALLDADHLAILLFSVTIGGIVGVLTRNGGMAGIALWLGRLAKGPRGAQLSTAGLGLGVFFDDYANTLIVGNTMRPITDNMKVSREKLAYLVDSTAAPVASLAIVTTWIGFMVSLIADGLKGVEAEGLSAYSIFIDTLVYSFYPILALGLVFLVAGTGRDFGPMLSAERRARAGKADYTTPGEEEDLTSVATKPVPKAAPNAILAIIPLGILIFGTLGGIIATGMAATPDGASMRDIFGAGNSFSAMMWASLGAAVVAIAMTVAAGRLSLADSMESWLAGTRSMMLPAIVLSLAWAIAEVNAAVQTGDYLLTFLQGGVAAEDGAGIRPDMLRLLPITVFALAALMAFTTGTSWGVMGIMMPLVLPLAWAAVGGAEGLQGANAPIFYATIASVLGGAVWGDHCSPISDTTVMSSLAAGCDHAEHVRTQLPYALLAGAIAVFGGLMPVGFGVPWWVVLPLSALLMAALFLVVSARVEDGEKT